MDKNETDIVLRTMKIDKPNETVKITPNKTNGLGIRFEVDIPVQEDGLVYPNTGGLSAFLPPVENMHPNFRPPRSKSPVWQLDTSILGEFRLCYTLDSDESVHGVIGPVEPMPPEEFEDNINNTQPHWIKLN